MQRDRIFLSPDHAGWSDFTGTCLRAVSQFSNRWITTKNVGTNSTARQVDASMPENTVMPIDLRALAPAPVASTSGTTPRMKANDGIRIGRNRDRAASIADSKSGL